jgi:RNA polymerase sigma factor (sigma-70 family)
MSTEGSLTRCARELHASDPRRRAEAAQLIWERFHERLLGLIRKRLDARFCRRVDAEDVLQSLLLSFFFAPPGAQGTPRNRVELWRRLVRFAVCQVARTVEYHQAQRRDVRRERSLAELAADSSSSGPAQFELEDFRRLRPEAEAIAREEFLRLLAVLPEDLQHVFTLRLEGYTNREIAAQLHRVERTVELKLKVIRGLVRPHLGIANSIRPENVPPS